ncbi:thioredoxin-like protein [Papiliotrema laurentii]|uniref:Monothiol glutaredoxin-5, mitochondrial n=1 Tax=Papiliotrema laurentii TaxID=5418 RepID=A0AAD9FRY5_PAPLA|nr:thioredoxin-like protein [Papiliotrema laurentii]
MSFPRAGLRTLRAIPRAHVQLTSSLRFSQRYLSDQARKLIDDAVKENPLVVFMKGTPDAPQCGFSRAVCQILDVNGVERKDLKAFNCLADNELREGIKEYSDWPTIPQVYIKGEFVGGADIMYSMHQSGELEKLLVKEGIIPELPPLPEDAPAAKQ